MENAIDTSDEQTGNATGVDDNSAVDADDAALSDECLSEFSSCELNIELFEGKESVSYERDLNKEAPPPFEVPMTAPRKPESVMKYYYSDIPPDAKKRIESSFDTFCENKQKIYLDSKIELIKQCFVVNLGGISAGLVYVANTSTEKSINFLSMLALTSFIFSIILDLLLLYIDKWLNYFGFINIIKDANDTVMNKIKIGDVRAWRERKNKKWIKYLWVAVTTMPLIFTFFGLGSLLMFFTSKYQLLTILLKL